MSDIFEQAKAELEAYRQRRNTAEGDAMEIISEHHTRYHLGGVRSDAETPTPKLLRRSPMSCFYQGVAKRRRRVKLFAGWIALPRPTALGWAVLALLALLCAVVVHTRHAGPRALPAKPAVPSMAGYTDVAGLRRELDTTNEAVIGASRQAESADRKASTALKLAQGQLPGVQ